MEQELRDYVEAITPEHRPLFDRLHRLVLEAHPEAATSLSYGIPTYRVGRHRLHVGMWRHGASLYGWGQGRDSGFAARHPALTSGRGTIRLRPQDAAAIPDQELLELVRAALDD
ncbi:iron chaperone [Streptacidiphilus sp. P02-A3a]|uniref:iron chaperone n=1 Tax=Streptacidiphilus sp. P02-A3a TaxID=2704468 RepID=UPI0015FACF85|nr:DUF1801 domain-containing protein [Streptacidiphilus sp. P02-A3a]QMU70609.1 DUF1801 domain-containing protein [Streptacidiphilus sp. P02-A3a]